MFTNTSVAVTETVALILWGVKDGIVDSNYFLCWESQLLFFGVVSEFACARSSPCVTFPHDEIKSLVGFHSPSEGVWCLFVWSKSTKTSSGGVLEVSKKIVNDFDGMTALLEDQSTSSSSGNIIDILGSIWILDSKVLISEDQINLTHIEIGWLTFLGHETSPGTK
jgi:hypothetical protein